MPEIFCNRCRLDVEPEVEKREFRNGGGYHLRATCPLCKNLIKFLPQGKPAAFYFGKYKGELIVDVAVKDPEYLRSTNCAVSSTANYSRIVRKKQGMIPMPPRSIIPAD